MQVSRPQSIPPQRASQRQAPSTHAPCPEQFTPYLARKPGQKDEWLQSSPAHSGSQVQFPSAHTPCPLQSAGHGSGREQLTPFQPRSQVHVPLWQDPCSEQFMGHRRIGETKNPRPEIVIANVTSFWGALARSFVQDTSQSSFLGMPPKKASSVVVWGSLSKSTFNSAMAMM